MENLLKPLPQKYPAALSGRPVGARRSSVLPVLTFFLALAACDVQGDPKTGIAPRVSPAPTVSVSEGLTKMTGDVVELIGEAGVIIAGGLSKDMTGRLDRINQDGQ